MKYKLCVWDLDGTLIDTMPTLHDLDNRSLLHFGFKPITYDQSIILIKYPLGQYYENLLRMGGCEEDRVDELAGQITEYSFDLYRQDPTHLAREFPGVRETLASIKEMGIANAVFSNKFQEISEQIADHYYRDYISAVFGQHPDHPSKPQTGCTDRILQTTGFSPEEILIIGDTEVDVMSAKNNHIDCVSVTWGYQDREVLEQLGPDYMIDTPQELLKIIT